MNRKETTLIAIVGMAIFATVMATSSSTKALALVYDMPIHTQISNDNGEETSGDGNANDKDSSHVAYDDLQVCPSIHSEQVVQDCMDSSYRSGSNDILTESTDNGDEDESGNTEDASTRDLEDEEDDWG